MKKEDLRRVYGNKTGEKIRVERIITYNIDYVHYLEEKIIAMDYELGLYYKLLDEQNLNK